MDYILGLWLSWRRQYSVLVQGVSRIRVLSVAEEGPMLHATVVRLHDQGSIADAEVRGCAFREGEARVVWT